MVLAVSAERLWTVLYYNVESTREWNSSVGLIEVRIMYLVKVINLHLLSVEFIGVFRPRHTWAMPRLFF